MPVPTVTISAETYVGLARSTINGSGIRCEWGHGRDTCQVVVSCWEALRLHYRHHVLSLRPKKDKRSRDVVHAMCKLPRCNVVLGHVNSLEQLWNHVESSHLSRVPLVCPVEGCRPHLRSSPAALKHFSDEHRNLNQTTHSLPSPLLKSSWHPFFPSNYPEPPPLPQNPGPGCVLISTSPNSLRNRKGLTVLPLSSQASFSGASPRKQSQQIPKEIPVEDDELDVPDFNQLPRYSWDDEYWSNEITVWRSPAMFNMDVARPQRMLDGPPSETLKSISYEVFAKQVDGLERRGLL